MIKKCRKKILNISSLVSPCLRKGYFSEQYFNYKIILECLNEYYRAKTPYKSAFCNHIKDITIIFLLWCIFMNLVLCQNNNLINHTTNCEIFHQISWSTLFQRWYLVENESWLDVHVSTLFQHWQKNVQTTLTELRRFNVDVVSTLIVSSKWNLSQRMFIGVASTLRNQHLNNFINCCTNIH